MAGHSETPDSYQAELLASLPASFELTFMPGGNDNNTRAMKQWLEDLVHSSRGKLSVLEKSGAKQPLLPCIGLHVPGASPVHYYFIPQGKERAPFLDLIRQLTGHKQKQGQGRPAKKEESEQIELLLFVSIHCPNCPTTVSIVHSFAMTIPTLTIHIIDIMEHPELAEDHNIQSVPTLIVENKLRYVGTLPKDRLLKLLRLGDHQSFIQEEIRQMIEQGKAVEAGNLIAEGNNPSFLKEDLGNSTFQTRLGILLALEEALEIDPRSLDALVKPVLPFLEAEDAALRGDLADLLGKIGHQDALPGLKKLCADPDPDVAEAAGEALAMINSR